MNFFSIHNTLVHIPLGTGYDLSWIEAVGTVAGLLCIWLASQEKISNYFYGLINVSLFAVIFFQIHLYANLLLQLFFFVANIYGWYAWHASTDKPQLKIRWLSWQINAVYAIIAIILIVSLSHFINEVFGYLSALTVKSLNQVAGTKLIIPPLEKDAWPIGDSASTVLSMFAMILMTRKYVENWLLWVIVDVVSIVIFASQGVYVMALEYIILLAIALNGSYLWIKKARENRQQS